MSSANTRAWECKLALQQRLAPLATFTAYVESDTVAISVSGRTPGTNGRHPDWTIWEREKAAGMAAICAELGFTSAATQPRADLVYVKASGDVDGVPVRVGAMFDTDAARRIAAEDGAAGSLTALEAT